MLRLFLLTLVLCFVSLEAFQYSTVLRRQAAASPSPSPSAAPASPAPDGRGLNDTGFWMVAGTQLRRIGNLAVNCDTANELLISLETERDWILRNTHLFVGPSSMAPQGSFQCYPFNHTFTLLNGSDINRVHVDNFTVPLENGLLDENFCVHIAAHADIAHIAGNLAELEVLEEPIAGCCHESTIEAGDFEGEEQRSLYLTRVDGELLFGWSWNPEMNASFGEQFCGEEISSYDPTLLNRNLIDAMAVENLPQANYLINNVDRYLDTSLMELTGGVSMVNISADEGEFCQWQDIQLALWRLFGFEDASLEGSNTQCVEFIFNDAFDNGADFVPCCGGDFLVLLSPSESDNVSTSTANANATQECVRREDLPVTFIVRHVTECIPIVQSAQSWSAVRPGGPAPEGMNVSRMMGNASLDFWGNGTQNFLIANSDICSGVNMSMFFGNQGMGMEAGAGGLNETAAGGDEQLAGDSLNRIQRAFQWESTLPIFFRFCFPQHCRAAAGGAAGGAAAGGAAGR